MPKENLTGQKFSDWVVIKDTGKRKATCQCSCGIIKEVDRYTLLNGSSKNCGHTRRESTYDLVGKKFGEWEVIRYLGNQMWECKCSCGTVKAKNGRELRRGNSRSCGCKQGDYCKDTLMERYGGVSTHKIGDAREKWQIEAIQNAGGLEKAINSLSSSLKIDKPTIKQLSEFLAIDTNMTLIYVYKYNLENLMDINPNKSSIEKTVIDMIHAINPSIELVTNKRGLVVNEPNLEVDIFVPSMQLAIEINGTYWHSSKNKPYKYHQDKTIKLAKQGIRLVHIFEYEILIPKYLDRLKQYLTNIFIPTRIKIYARNTHICNIQSNIADEFLNTYHIQGTVKSSIRYGIYDTDNALIGVATFGKCRFEDTTNGYELYRLCWKTAIDVIGGTDKIIKKFMDEYHPDYFITYTDTAKFTGNSYAKLKIGLKLEGITSPNYVWVSGHNKEVLPRYRTTKASLVSKGLGTEDETEDTIMERLGYFKLYDSGNLKFTWTNTSTKSGTSAESGTSRTSGNKNTANTLNTANTDTILTSSKHKQKDSEIGKQYGEWVVVKHIEKQNYLCRCSCGLEKEVYIGHLKRGLSKSCGHSSTKFKDLTNKQYGEWKALRYLGNHQWECQCSCGVIKAVSTYDLTSGKSKSCGHNTTSFKNLTGMQIGEWSILGYLGDGFWECKCSCGKVQKVDGRSLRAGTSKSCGHKEYLDLTGQKFWEWTALEWLGNHLWLCKCSCGTLRVMTSQRLRSGESKSCGCKKTENYIKSIGKKYPNMTNISQKHLTYEQLVLQNDEIALKNLLVQQDGVTPAQLSGILRGTPCQAMRIMRKYGLETYVKLNKPVAKYEDEINKLFYCNNRSFRGLPSGKEIDLYYPEQRFGIEFNGTYWHSDIFKDKYYHKDKTIEAYKNGIELFHIFEYEWADEKTKEKIIGLLEKKLGQTEIRRIAARDCKVKHIDWEDAKIFLDKYHLQNSITAEVYIGCYIKDELIGAMTFGKPRFNKEAEWELLRLAWKNDVAVMGGTNKLFHYFLRNYSPSSIISYCDISKFSGNSYTKMGFKSVEITEPNYKWINCETNDIMSRYQTTKQKLIKLGFGNETETEKEIMEKLGYVRVYDCGNIKLTWKKNNTMID